MEINHRLSEPPPVPLRARQQHPSPQVHPFPLLHHVTPRQPRPRHSRQAQTADGNRGYQVGVGRRTGHTTTYQHKQRQKPGLKVNQTYSCRSTGSSESAAKRRKPPELGTVTGRSAGPSAVPTVKLALSTRKRSPPRSSSIAVITNDDAGASVDDRRRINDENDSWVSCV